MVDTATSERIDNAPGLTVTLSGITRVPNSLDELRNLTFMRHNELRGDVSEAFRWFAEHDAAATLMIAGTTA